MITIDEKLYITKEVNQILVKYAEKIVLKNLLFSYSFENRNDFKKLTELVQDVRRFCPNRPIKSTAIQLTKFCESFLRALPKDEQTAIYFWVLNHKYEKYLDIEESLEEHELEEDAKHRAFEEKFGRELAQKMYEPEGTEFEKDCIELLSDYLISFTDQLDLSLIDQDTIESVLEQIEIGIWA